MSRTAVRLRAMEPEDLDFLYAIENCREVWDIGNTNVPYSRYVLHDYIANASNDIYRDGQVRLIIENAEGESVGIADVFDFNAQHRRAEVSIVVKRSCRRLGFGESAMLQMLDYARHTLRLHQIYAVVSVLNEASLSLFSKLGFKRHNTLEEWLFDGEKYIDAVMMQKIF